MTTDSSLQKKQQTEQNQDSKIRSCNVKDVILEPIDELWNMNPEFGKASKFINHPNNLPDFTPDT